MSDSPVAAPGSRREARERVLGLLYEAESKGTELSDVIDGLPLPLTGYASQIAEAIGSDLTALDHLINDASHHWSVPRMPAIDRALLRMATFELRDRTDIPAGAVISEAVELAGEYSTDSSSRFVNGILGRLATDLRPDEPNVGTD